MKLTIDQIKAAMKTNAADTPDPRDVEARRKGMEDSTANLRPHHDVAITSYELSSVPGLKLEPETAVGSKTLLYFHGGGYILGSPDTHKGMVSYIAEAMGATAYLPHYRLGPETPFPAAVEDGLACYRALLESGIAAENIIIAGDSAGGGLTLATCLMAKDRGLATPAGLAVLSPWANLNQIGHSYDTRADADPWITRDGLNIMADQYLGASGDADDPYASPLYGDLTGFPPLLIQVGADEVLFSDSIALADRAGVSGVAVTLEVWPEMIHVFQSFYPFLDEAQAAIKNIAEWSLKQLG